MADRNKVCVVTGAGGLIGSECVKYFSNKFDKIAMIDNNSRAEFFGQEASVESVLDELLQDNRNKLIPIDISDRRLVEETFRAITDVSTIDLIIHCAAQPSHDWAAKDPHRDFNVNAVGTLNLLEACRQYCSEAVFIFMSTNKVYGDIPNEFPYEELDTRYDMTEMVTIGYDEYMGFREDTQIDQCIHSIFGVSKTAADLMTQEYGKYFGMKTGVFRGGCLTGPAHKGAQLHGFLSYLVKCIVHEKEYTIFGYQGKQVRDQIHSADVVRAFDQFYNNPKKGEVYNLGGGRHANCSVLEAIDIVERKTGKKAIIRQVDQIRKGDHQWYITDMSKFKHDYPEWDYTYTLEQIIDEIIKSY